MMKANHKIVIHNSKHFKNASKKPFFEFLCGYFSFLVFVFPPYYLLFCASFCSFVFFLGLALPSVLPFWMYLCILTCFLIFAEFEMKDLSKKCNTGSRHTKNGQEILEKNNVKNLDYCEKTRIWSIFESRKGFRVLSYVGFFFWGVWNFFF